MLAVTAVLAALVLKSVSWPAQGAQHSISPASHLTGHRLRYLYGSGSVTGGRQISLRVQLTGPARCGGAVVSLSSERPSIIPLPATVTVPAVCTEVTLKATTIPVKTDVYV